MNIIRQLRAQTGLTQAGLSQRAGTSQSTIAAYEHENKSPTLRTVERLAESVGLRIAWRYQRPQTREELRSIAYHRAVCEILSTDKSGSAIKRAKRNLTKTKQVNQHATKLLNLWRASLDLPIATLQSLMLDQTELGADMRQVSPFAGILPPGKRREILRSFASDYSNE